jgi:hypothetical protein
LRFTLLSDGASDQALLPILIWSLRRHGVTAIEPQWADTRRVPNPPRTPGPRIRLCLSLYPCELLFIHRDAEGAPLTARREEIAQACGALIDCAVPPWVAVVPVRMMEAWLLNNENAIREAAGNPRGRRELNLPTGREIEGVADPKALLHRAIVEASGLGHRRRRSLNPRQLVYRVAELIDDFAPLDRLPAFVRFNTELRGIVEQTHLGGV